MPATIIDGMINPLRPAHLLLLCSLLWIGCGSETQSPPSNPTEPAIDPAQTVTTFLQAYFGKQLKTYYGMVTYRDRAAKPFETLEAEFAPSSADLVTDFLFQFTQFKIDSTHVDGETAQVFVTARSPNLNFVLRDAGRIERDLGEDTELETKLSLLAERYRMSGSPKESQNSVYNLILEDGQWHVVVGWADPPPEATP